MNCSRSVFSWCGGGAATADDDDAVPIVASGSSRESLPPPAAPAPAARPAECACPCAIQLGPIRDLMALLLERMNYNDRHLLRVDSDLQLLKGRFAAKPSAPGGEEVEEEEEAAAVASPVARARGQPVQCDCPCAAVIEELRSQIVTLLRRVDRNDDDLATVDRRLVEMERRSRVTYSPNYVTEEEEERMAV